MLAKHYDNDFKVTIVELLKSGRKSTELSKEYNLNNNTIRRWRREFDLKSGDFSKKRELTAEEIELKTLKKELKEITLERDILKKAVSIFSKSDK
ncbi:MAG: transposase [Chlamydiia bacterium]|nr:transposase [Chlamydiia bacterium]